MSIIISRTLPLKRSGNRSQILIRTSATDYAMKSRRGSFTLHGLMLRTQNDNQMFAYTLLAIFLVSLIIAPLTPDAHAAAAVQRKGELPDWLKLDGETRARFETLGGQFRANGSGGDQLLALRTLLRAQVQIPTSAAQDNHVPAFSLGIELQDSRTYLGDDGTPLSSSYANPMDVLQLYARADNLPSLIDADATSHLTLGRQTVSIGSKRQIERVSYANVIKSYTGAHWINQSQQGHQLHAIYLVPVTRRPSRQAALFDNELAADKEQWQRRIWGLHFIKQDILPKQLSNLQGEAFIYGLEEDDSQRVQTPDRSYVSTGFRLFRPAEIQRWDVDLEAAYRSGTRYASSNPSDTDSLKVRARMLLAALGYTFDAAWQPRLSLEYYYASGDADPNDNKFDQYERLFGGRRTDLNNTSIHGPLTPANLSAPGVRLRVKPNNRLDGWFQYHAASLASARDRWVIAKRRDPLGQSGKFIGHTLDARLRYWLLPQRVRLEVGASVLLAGDFVRQAPDKPEAEDTYFGYVQATLHF